jgi:hypothetical protein
MARKIYYIAIIVNGGSGLGIKKPRNHLLDGLRRCIGLTGRCLKTVLWIRIQSDPKLSAGSGSGKIILDQIQIQAERREVKLP